MRIGEVAARSGVPARTIRFWEAERLLGAPARGDSGYREFEPRMIERLAFIRRGQAAAMSLSQIRQVLEIGDSGAAPCRHVTELIDARLREVEERLEELEATRALLQELARRAGAQDPAACEGFCSILSPASSGRPGWSGPRSRGS